MSQLSKWLLLGVVLLIGMSKAHAIVIIDAFDTSQGPVGVSGTPAGPMSAFNAAAASGAVGGNREILVDRLSNNAGGVSADVNQSFTPGFAYAEGPNTEGQVQIVWDGADNTQGINFTGLGGLDLTEGGLNNQIRISRTSDLGATGTLRIYTSQSNVSAVDFTIPASPSFGTFEDTLIPFSAFTGSANFANVGAIELLLDTDTGLATDIAFRFIRTEPQTPTPVGIPEPSTIVLMLIGGSALGISAIRRRRQKSA
jgi:hypothetical protein